MSWDIFFSTFVFQVYFNFYFSSSCSESGLQGSWPGAYSSTGLLKHIVAKHCLLRQAGCSLQGDLECRKCSCFSPISTALPKLSIKTCLKMGCKVNARCLKAVEMFFCWFASGDALPKWKCWLVKSLTFSIGAHTCNLPQSVSKLGKIDFGCQSHSRNGLGFAELADGLHFLVSCLPAF